MLAFFPYVSVRRDYLEGAGCGGLSDRGQELLADEVAGIIMGIFIVVAVAELFHQLGRGVSQMQGDGQVTCLSHQFEGIVDGHIGRVAFGTGGEVNRGLCKWNASFGPAHFHNGVETGIGK